MLLGIKNYTDLRIELANCIIMVTECKLNCKTDLFWQHHQKRADRLLGVLIKLRKRNLDRGFPYTASEGVPVITALFKEFRTEIEKDLKFRYFSPAQMFEKKAVQRKLLAEAIKKEYR